MHIRTFNPLEFRKEKKRIDFKNQESTNCQHRIGDDDIIAPSKNDINLLDILSTEGINRLIARKRFLPTKQSLSYLVNHSRELWTAYKGLISLIVVRLAIIISVLGGITKIIRCERKSIVSNSKEFVSSERLRNVSSPLPFSIFHKCLNAVLSFRKELWHCDFYAPGKIPESPVSLTFGCDTPEEVAEPPVLHLPSPGSPIMLVVQVRQFSWHYSDKHGLSDMRQKFVKNNKQINSVSLFPPSQTPLVSKVRLLRVTRKIGQQERARGEHFSVSVFKSLSKGERNVTSSSIPAKNKKDENISYSIKCNAGMGVSSPKHLHINNIHMINNCEVQEKEKEREGPSTGRLGHDDIIASSKSDVTQPAVLSVERISRLVARKHFLLTEHSALSLIDNFRKRWMAYKGLVSLIIIRLIMILGMLGGLTKIRRCERRSVVGNSMEFGSSEKLGNVGALYPFNIFRKCLITVLGFQRKLWHCGMIYLLWERNKLGMRERKKLWSFSSRPILKLRHLRLGNIFKETFGLRSGNVMETLMARKRSGICLCLFLDLCASCHSQLRLFKINLKFRNRFKVIYVNIYLYIYTFSAVACYPASWHHTLGFSLLKCMLWFIFLQK